MKILLIGGTGLISAPITQFLLERGDDVTHYNRGKLDLYPAPAGVKTIHGDRTDYAAFENQMRALDEFDCVMDMVGYDPKDAESAVRAFEGRVGQFIFCSTVDVYQKPATRYPYVETEPYGGLNAYSSNKVAQEKTLCTAGERGAFPLTIIRPAYTYGEGRGPIHSFGGRTTYLDRLRKGKPIIVHGDGSSFWTACYREDVAHTFVEAAGNPQTFGKLYHATGEEWMTWDRYHEMVAEAMGAPKPTFVHIPTDALAVLAPQPSRLIVENFQFNNIFDNAAAKRDLRFEYTVTWNAGVQKMVRWLDEHRRVEHSEDDPFIDELIARWESLLQERAR